MKRYLPLLLARRFCITAVLTLALVLQMDALAYTVTTLADSGPGSLRDALTTSPPYENINFSVVGTITLTSGELVINAPHGIIGPGADKLTISGNNASRVINIVPGGFIVMSGVTIADGYAAGGDGGGIATTGPGGLYLSLVTIRDNVADGNGGGCLFLRRKPAKWRAVCRLHIFRQSGRRQRRWLLRR